MAREINLKELNEVVGGDIGDSAQEGSSSPDTVNFLYSVGQRVEVYNSAKTHCDTTFGTILDRITKYKNGHYVGSYIIKLDTGIVKFEIDADQIKSN